MQEKMDFLLSTFFFFKENSIENLQPTNHSLSSPVKECSETISALSNQSTLTNGEVFFHQFIRHYIKIRLGKFNDFILIYR